jgi:N-acetylornithine carbamoyltransferase
MMGMEVTLAHPKGMELDPKILEQCQTYANEGGGSFRITNDFEDGIKGAHVVYPKAWCATSIFQPPIGQSDAKKTMEIFDQNKSWICNKEIMDMADKQAIYMHCLPCDRGYEVTNDVIDKTSGSGWLSAAFDEAENRLHVQKAVMALLMH